MTGKPPATFLALVPALAAALALAATPLAAAASSCSCTMASQKACIDATSTGPNAICDTKKCPSGARFSTEACPRKDLVATCSLKGPDYATHNRYYAPKWKLETVKAMCAGMKGDLSPAAR